MFFNGLFDIIYEYYSDKNIIANIGNLKKELNKSNNYISVNKARYTSGKISFKSVILNNYYNICLEESNNQYNPMTIYNI